MSYARSMHTVAAGVVYQLFMGCLLQRLINNKWQSINTPFCLVDILVKFHFSNQARSSLTRTLISGPVLQWHLSDEQFTQHRFNYHFSDSLMQTIIRSITILVYLRISVMRENLWRCELVKLLSGVKVPELLSILQRRVCLYAPPNTCSLNTLLNWSITQWMIDQKDFSDLAV